MLLKPTEAPQVHIELLPDTTIAVDVHADNNTFGITLWASAPPMPAVSGENLDNLFKKTLVMIVNIIVKQYQLTLTV